MTIATILCVDDSSTDLSNIKSVVSGAGYKVLEATDGNEAISVAIDQRPDLILMDVIMPNKDGFEACRDLSTNPDTKDIPVVFVSSKNQKADEVWAELQGGKGIIGKPYNGEDVIAKIKSFE